MFSKPLIIVTAVLAAVSAQDTTVTNTGSATAYSVAPAASASASLTPCILACIKPAASQNGCASYADLKCVCTSSQFQADAGACIQTHCTTADLQTALGLQAQCAAVSLYPTSSGATPHSVSFTSPAGTSTATATSPTMTTPVSPTASSVSNSRITSATSPTGSTTAGSASAAASLIVNSGVAAIVAMVVAFLVI